MQLSMSNMKMLNRNGLLYPMLVIAAIAVIVFSAFGVATMLGWLPRAESMGTAHALNDAHVMEQPMQQSVRNDRMACADCGVVDSILPVSVNGSGSGSGLGMVAGGLTGALVGNQLGRGNGNALATIAGAAGGAYAGNTIEKNLKNSVRYEVRVHMQDGTYRTCYQAATPAFVVGSKVKVVDGHVVVSG
jgi:outer membrane lipoprotein SlyB